MDTSRDLEYFRGLMSEKSPGTPKHSPEIWNERANDWDAGMRKKGVRKEKAETRIREAVKFLKENGLLGPDCDVIDIGCGPGRFVAEFAKTAHHVTGTDYSAKMLEYGSIYAREQGLSNVSFTLCDFKQADVEEMGWTGKFDLVFSSMTPAMRASDSIDKMIKMSRGCCCNASCIVRQSEVDQQIARDLNLGTAHSRWDGSGFYVFYNIVYLMGYLPRVAYYKISYTEQYPVTMELAQARAAEICRDEDAGNAPAVYQWLMEHAEDGMITDRVNSWHGFVLWDVRQNLLNK